MREVSTEETRTRPETRRICGHFVGPAGYTFGYVDELCWRWVCYLAMAVARRYGPEWSRIFPLDGYARVKEAPP